ncbi:hypothetical protein [Prosthecobacter sp.]|uniref:hypothetical protein n=1 Tax=Prosthecobacter sp. TaxID=1965333 RepID=UPI00378366F1
MSAPDHQTFSYYGQFISEAGLRAVMRALEPCSWRIELRQSGYDGTNYLTTPSDQDIDLDMDSGQSGCFLFGGGFEGSKERALKLLKDFSQCLSAGNFTHRIEVYDESDNEIARFHHQWPEGLTDIEFLRQPSDSNR